MTIMIVARVFVAMLKEIPLLIEVVMIVVVFQVQVGVILGFD
jgi:hypothetical protein